MAEGFPSDPTAGDEWPSTKSLPSGGLAELKQSDQLLPTEVRGTERMAVGNEEGTKPNCEDRDTHKISLWVTQKGWKGRQR